MDAYLGDFLCARNADAGGCDRDPAQWAPGGFCYRCAIGHAGTDGDGGGPLGSTDDDASSGRDRDADTDSVRAADAHPVADGREGVSDAA